MLISKQLKIFDDKQGIDEIGGCALYLEYYFIR
jgi:hypothetical protein